MVLCQVNRPGDKASHDSGARVVEVEVLPPKPKPGKASSELDEIFALGAKIMDSFFRVPGTKFTFGVNPLIGLIPVVGDQIDTSLSVALLIRSLKHRIPRIVLARMGLNVLINAFFQGIPILGDMCTFFFKANRRNYALLKRYAGTGKPVTRGDWIFVLGVLAATFAVAVALSTFLVWLVISQFRPFG